MVGVLIRHGQSSANQELQTDTSYLCSLSWPHLLATVCDRPGCETKFFKAIQGYMKQPELAASVSYWR